MLFFASDIFLSILKSSINQQNQVTALSRPLATVNEFTSHRQKPHSSHRSTHSCIFSNLVQTPFSPFREIWQCHLCGHEGHLVESCLLPAECILLASGPWFLILAPEKQHKHLFSEDRQTSPQCYRFSSYCHCGCAVPLWHSALCRSSCFPVFLTISLPILPSSHSASQHRDISLLHPEVWDSQYHSLLAS